MMLKIVPGKVYTFSQHESNNIIKKMAIYRSQLPHMQAFLYLQTDAIVNIKSASFCSLYNLSF